MPVKKKKTKEFEVWANKEMRKFQDVLMLNHFDLSKIKPSHSEDTSYSVFRYPYKDIEIQYADSLYDYWAKGEKVEAHKILLHEMLHPLTDALYAVATDRFISRSQVESEREALTDHLTNIIYKLTNG